jgi:hypothetical protein
MAKGKKGKEYNPTPITLYACHLWMGGGGMKEEGKSCRKKLKQKYCITF